MGTWEKHLAAIEAGRVTKSNVIGIRKAINARWRTERGYSGSRTAPDWTAFQIAHVERLLDEKEPAVVGDLHDSGVKLLRSRRWRSRFNEAQLAIIHAPHVLFSLVRFDRIGHGGSHCVPVYRITAFAGNFLFRNIPWQSAVYGGDGEESGNRTARNSYVAAA